VVSEGAREAAAVIEVHDARLLRPEQAYRFMQLLLEHKIGAEGIRGRSFVSDRTIIDCAAYWLYRELQGMLADLDRERERYFEAIFDHLNAGWYDWLIFVEAGGIPWVDDGFRTKDAYVTDALLLGLMHGRFRRALQNAGTAVVILPKEVPTLEERVSFVLDHIIG
jgi:hypothetical protein